jgi:hypothetical protein
MSKRCSVLLGMAIMIGCVDRSGAENDDATPPPDDEAFAIVETFCENIGVPCNIEEPCGPDEGIPCYSMEDCLDANYSWGYQNASDTCKYHTLELMKCKSALTCREAEADRVGRADYCDEERWDSWNAGCATF